MAFPGDIVDPQSSPRAARSRRVRQLPWLTALAAGLVCSPGCFVDSQEDAELQAESATAASCDAQFGKTKGYELCSSDANSCSFNAQKDKKMSCDDVCAAAGSKCLTAFGNGSVNCKAGGKVSCSLSTHFNDICVCEQKPACSGGDKVLTSSSTKASDSGNDGNVAKNTLDGDASTRWSNNVDGGWIQYDLGSKQSVNAVRIAWYKGDQRKAKFDVLVGDSPSKLSAVLSGATASGSTTGFETYSFAATQARYVRIVGHGNSKSAWNSILEVEVRGGCGGGTGSGGAGGTGGSGGSGGAGGSGGSGASGGSGGASSGGNGGSGGTPANLLFEATFDDGGIDDFDGTDLCCSHSFFADSKRKRAGARGARFKIQHGDPWGDGGVLLSIRNPSAKYWGEAGGYTLAGPERLSAQRLPARSDR